MQAFLLLCWLHDGINIPSDGYQHSFFADGGGVRTSPNAKTLNPVTLTGVSIAIPRNSFLARGRNVLPNCAAGPNEPNDSEEDSDDSSSTET